jgi:hypothetical protein
MEDVQWFVQVAAPQLASAAHFEADEIASLETRISLETAFDAQIGEDISGLLKGRRLS